MDAACFVMVVAPAHDRIARDADACLHPRELTYLGSLTADKRKREFLLGRFAAKQAMAWLRPGLSGRDVDIEFGVFQQPVVAYADPQPLSVCITHSGRLTAAVAFPAGHPLGIDIERVDPAHLAALKSQITEDEAPPAATGAAMEEERFTRVWTIKEALSKILRCGLMTPFSLFKPVDAAMNDDGVYTGGFQCFRQYRFLSLAAPRAAFALVHPARTTPVFEWQRVARFLREEG